MMPILSKTELFSSVWNGLDQFKIPEDFSATTFKTNI